MTVRFEWNERKNPVNIAKHGASRVNGACTQSVLLSAFCWSFTPSERRVSAR